MYHIIVSGAPLPNMDCKKGGMSCNKNCEEEAAAATGDDGIADGGGRQCETVMTEQCQDVPREVCRNATRKVCENVSEEICEPDEILEPLTK